MNERIKLIEAAWLDRTLLQNTVVQEAVFQTVEDLDKGVLRVAEPNLDFKAMATEFVDEQLTSAWIVHEWIKKAVILYFPLRKMETIECPPFEFHDKIPLKKNYAELGVRVVPHAIARHGAFINRDVVMMPSYVNIGAYVDSGTMVDTWATVGSCAEIGKHVHLSGGVGIGGVLEPVQAAPVIIEDGAFIGSRCILVEGVRVGKEAVLGANVTITGSSKIIDVTQKEPVIYRGYVPPRSVVIPGSYPKKFPAGEYHVPCALIIGQRSESTDLKTSLNDALRQNDVAV